MAPAAELAARLLHPRHRIPRTYRVKIHGHPTSAALAQLRRGVRLDDGVTGSAQVDVERTLPSKAWLRFTIHEGRRREIRRMCEAVGYRVDRLVRIRFGPIELRELDPGQIGALRAAVGLSAATSRSANLTSSEPAGKHQRSSRARAAMRGVEQSGSSRGS